jgi:uncharacterized coiled-coil protein SlyX
MFDDLIRRLDQKDIRKVIKECDSDDLAYALTGASDIVKSIVFGSLSESAEKMIKGDIESYHHIQKEYIETAQEKITHLIQKLSQQGDITLHDQPLEDVPVSKSRKPSEKSDDIYNQLTKMLNKNYGYSDNDLKDIVEIMVSMTRLIRMEGLLYLENLLPYTKENIIKKGLSYIMDGLEPGLIKEMLNRYKKTVMERMEKKLDLIIDGLSSVQSGDNPYVINEKLNLYISDE